MERWNTRAGRNVANPKVDAFLCEIVDVCKRFKMSIAHEDTQGAFLIHGLRENNLEWLLGATDETDL